MERVRGEFFVILLLLAVFCVVQTVQGASLQQQLISESTIEQVLKRGVLRVAKRCRQPDRDSGVGGLHGRARAVCAVRFALARSLPATTMLVHPMSCAALTRRRRMRQTRPDHGRQPGKGQHRQERPDHRAANASQDLEHGDKYGPAIDEQQSFWTLIGEDWLDAGQCRGPLAQRLKKFEKGLVYFSNR